MMLLKWKLTAVPSFQATSMTFHPLRYLQSANAYVSTYSDKSPSVMPPSISTSTVNIQGPPWNPRSCVFAERSRVPFDPNHQNNLQHIGTAIKRFAPPVQGEYIRNSFDGIHSEWERIQQERQWCTGFTRAFFTVRTLHACKVRG